MPASSMWNRACFGYTIGHEDDDLIVRRARQRAVRAEMRRRRPDFDWQDEPQPAVVPWDRTIIYETHVRGFTKLHPAVPEQLRGTFAGLGDQGGHRLHQVARRHLGRAAADPHVRQRQPSARQGPDQLLGLQHDRLLRARSALCRRPARHAAGIQGDGRAPPRRRPRGDPRRRLQPHRRGQRARPDPVVQGHRQRVLLPADARREALLHQRHRHRQHAQHSAIRASSRW